MMCEDCVMYGRCHYYVCPLTRYDEASDKQPNSTSDKEVATHPTEMDDFTPDDFAPKVSKTVIRQEQTNDIEYHVLQYEGLTYSSIAFYPD